MWPRGDSALGPGADMTAARRSKNSGLSGFVSFMRRKDAEAALKEFDGFDWGGSILRVGWSKAVPIAAKPMYGQCTMTVLVTKRQSYLQRCISCPEISLSQPDAREA
jgi:U2-associated protein SR140